MALSPSGCSTSPQVLLRLKASSVLECTAMPPEPTPRFAPWRLAAWLAFVGILAALGFLAQLEDDTPDDLAYRWESSLAALIQAAIVVGVLLLVTRGLRRREVFALRRPRSWPRAVGYAVLALLAIYIASFIYVVVSNADPTEEQGLLPDGWDPDRAGALIAFFVAVTVIAPLNEELLFRGAGFSFLAPYGTVVAVVVTGILFGVVHGLLEALPVLAFFGVAVGWLRWKTGSVYPGMLLHGTFNALAVIVAVTS
jgi:membrane protease YdiL (CAAX protease family)